MFLSRNEENYSCVHSQFTKGKIYTSVSAPVLQIRRGNRDNLEISFHITP